MDIRAHREELRLLSWGRRARAALGFSVPIYWGREAPSQTSMRPNAVADVNHRVFPLRLSLTNLLTLFIFRGDILGGLKP